MVKKNNTRNVKGGDDSLIKLNKQNDTKLRIVSQNVSGPVVVASEIKKRQGKSDLGDNFVAPDGGWGWLVAIAAGMSVLVTYPVLQQFGVLFRKQFVKLGISTSEMTTIINSQQAAAMCSGLFNGPLFRRLSYRQVALIGNFFVFMGLFSAAFANSFLHYFISISLLYGTGRGIMFSSMTLAVNTFFKKKRQEATACQYSVAGVGGIMLPYLCTFLVDHYGVAGAVLLLSGMSLHNLACTSIYQPVKWHVKKISKTGKSQHNNNDDASDSDKSLDLSTCKLQIPPTKYHPKDDQPPKTQNWLPEQTELLQKSLQIPTAPEADSILKKIATFFDFDLLRDFGYVNLAMGLTLMNIIEMNFHYLTPFILNEFGLDSSRIAAAMTAQAVCDLVIRFAIVIVVSRLKCDNKVWLIVGSIGMILGRIVLVYNRSNIMVLLCFAWMGLCSAIRLIFWILILPSYVPLKKLPAAIGLQRLIMGICNLIIGPFIGLIRDATNYTYILHIMNAIIVIVVISWWSEDLYKRCRQKKLEETL